MDIVVSNKASRPLYEQISTQIKAAIMSGELKTGEAIPSVRSLAKSLHIRDPPHNCAQTIHIIPATQISRKSAIQAHYLHTK